MLKVLPTILLIMTPILAQNSWSTKFEKSGFVSTSNYDETIEYFQALDDHSEYARLETIGISPQGRELKCMIVSKDKIFDPNRAQESGKAIILINNGIHSGEIEGKDACMLMLREMLVKGKKKDLIDNVILLIIPVFNVDGHERSSPFNRINQNGPTEMGWRTTSQNYNLNRDFTKADSPEMKSFLKLFSTWLPDIFIDNHTTNGADYQYTITYAVSKNLEVPPPTRKIVKEELIPEMIKGVNKAGYLISPYAGFIDRDYNKGIRDWISPPRFSNGYGAVQNRIGLLVETHMLKPYKERVFSTKALLETVIGYSSRNHKKIREVSTEADKFVIDTYARDRKAYPIKFKVIDGGDKINYKGFKRELINSEITGGPVVSYKKEKTEKLVPYYNKAIVVDSVVMPLAYLIPKEWCNLVEILKLHRIEAIEITEETEFSVERIRFSNVKFASWTYEGRISPSFEYKSHKDTVRANVGDFLIYTDQRSLGMIAHLLEPKCSDSFVKWGFMNIIFERKEYFESYSMDPIAKKMYHESEKLRNEFLALVENDSAFAANPRNRLNFFYERSPYYDQKLNVYPILRVNKVLK